MQNQENSTYLFIGERPSPTALKKNLTWQDGQLSASQLFGALETCGFSPTDQLFCNLFFDERDEVNPEAVELIWALIIEGLTIVAMGKKVQQELDKLYIDYIPIVHPAARGAIRKKEKYAAMIAQQLGTTN